MCVWVCVCVWMCVRLYVCERERERERENEVERKYERWESDTEEERQQTCPISQNVFIY